MSAQKNSDCNGSSRNRFGNPRYGDGNRKNAPLCRAYHIEKSETTRKIAAESGVGWKSPLNKPGVIAQYPVQAEASKKKALTQKQSRRMRSNETELNHRWREGAWQTLGTVS
jgi:hypothetical protein